MPSPEHQQIVDVLRASNDPTIEPTVEGIRAVLDQLAQQFPTPADTTVTPIVLGGRPAERIEAPGLAADAPTILHFHGGAYIGGSLAFGRSLCARVSAVAGASVVSLDYRLAPEHPFPAALDDAMAAYRELIDQGVAPERLALLGDSAGGGLAYSALLELRAAGDSLPAGAALVSPWLDLRLSGASMRTKVGEDPVLSPAFLALGASSYLADGLDGPLARPLDADPAGLPPLLVLVGTAEILLDDATRLVERATGAGVDVSFEPSEGLIHEWPLFAHLPEAQDAVTRIGSWLRAHLDAG
jgi:monoterpene epsilon-lactone hydrolase